MIYTFYLFLRNKTTVNYLDFYVSPSWWTIILLFNGHATYSQDLTVNAISSFTFYF